MSAISLVLAEKPSKIVLSFSPRGGKIRVKVKFPEDSIPEHYRMQIIDSCNNTRLNRYGKGSEEGITLDWLIPTIREIHHGVWQVKIDSDTASFNKQFFVYPFEFSLFPMLPAGPVIPTTVPVEEIIPPSQIAIPAQEDVIGEEIAEERAEIALPVTMIKGIGKTFADRLANYEINTVAELVKYPDHTYLGEIMRVSDSRLAKMVENGRVLLEEEPAPEKEFKVADLAFIAESITFMDDSPIITIMDDSPIMNLVDIPGIGPKTASRLVRYEINTVADFVNFPDRTYLGEITRVSDTRLSKMIDNARRMLGEEVVSEQVVDVTSSAPDTVGSSIQNLLSLPGIGPKTVEKMVKIGINSLDDLLSYKNVVILRKTLRMSQNRFSNFISTLDTTDKKHGKQDVVKPAEKVDKADTRDKEDSIRSLTSIKGIGLKTAEKLNAAGIKSPDDLIKVDLGKLSLRTKISVKRLETWHNAALTSKK